MYLRDMQDVATKVKAKMNKDDVEVALDLLKDSGDHHNEHASLLERVARSHYKKVNLRNVRLLGEIKDFEALQRRIEDRKEIRERCAYPP